jgi:hypothetical protein
MDPFLLKDNMVVSLLAIGIIEQLSRDRVWTAMVLWTMGGGSFLAADPRSLSPRWAAPTRWASGIKPGDGMETGIVSRNIPSLRKNQSGSGDGSIDTTKLPWSTY